MIPLYQVPKNSRIRYIYENQEYLLNFAHVDGMYSLCTDDDDRTIHLAATTEVEVVNEDK